MNIGEWIVIGLSVFVGGWYLGGYYINRHRSEELGRWLRQGLGLFGEVRFTGKRGSMATGAKLSVGNPNQPLRQIQVAFMLEPRENLPLWVFEHVRGRRDDIVLQANFRSSPTIEFVIAPVDDPVLAGILSGERKAEYERFSWPNDYLLARKGKKGTQSLDGLRSMVEEFGQAKLRISIQGEKPHLILRARSGPLLKEDPEAFFGAFDKAVEGLKA